MRTTGIFEAKQNFSALIDAVEAGEEVRITRHGREVARILPIERRPLLTPEEIEAELVALKELHRRIKPGPGWRELRDEGRK